MKFFGIKTFYLLVLIILIVLVLFLTPFLGGALFLILGVVLLLLRKKKYKKQSNEHWSSNLFISPVSGKVVSIEESDVLEMTIKVGAFSGWGIYNPLKSRVLHFGHHDEKRKKLPLFWYIRSKSKIENVSHEFLELETKKYYYHYQFYRSWPWSELVLNVDTGDIGHVGACMGLCFGGGAIKIVLPDGFKVLVSRGDKVEATRTLLAKTRRKEL